MQESNDKFESKDDSTAETSRDATPKCNVNRHFKTPTIKRIYDEESFSGFGRNVDEKEEFYESLQATIDSYPQKENLIVLGDLNGHVGVNRHGIEDIIGAFGIGDSNPDGERIVEFCIRNQMAIMNTFFNHRPEHKWTWYRWNAEREEYSQKSMIDLVLTSRKSLVHDVKAFPSLSLDSDHRVVVCKINHQPPPILKRPCKQRIKVERLQEEAVKRDLEARLSNIQLPERETTLETMWQEVKGDLLKIAEEVVGVKWIGGTKKKRSAYWTEEVREAVANKNRAFRHWLKVRTEESRQRYVNLRNTAKTVQNRARDNVWRNIEPERVDERWEEYFRNLLNAPENGGTAEVEEEEIEFDEQFTGNMVDRITVSDVKDTLLKMRSNKATGYLSLGGWQQLIYSLDYSM
ncbi:uncharacterized protein LOC143017963 [Oratosquilla oratoria]|uniref:uncharacterized protein LOC143017963 n=1 Tax=Oratosquilla oratoria TaxID=337810 RepID=UPI003F76C9C9